MMTPDKDKKPLLNAVGQPEPETGQPVAPFQSDRPPGERQDGPGIGPRHHDRDDSLPVGSTAARRGEARARPSDPPDYRNN